MLLTEGFKCVTNFTSIALKMFLWQNLKIGSFYFSLFILQPIFQDERSCTPISRFVTKTLLERLKWNFILKFFTHLNPFLSSKFFFDQVVKKGRKKSFLFFFFLFNFLILFYLIYKNLKILVMVEIYVSVHHNKGKILVRLNLTLFIVV